jgi:hypothetical protein
MGCLFARITTRSVDRGQLTYSAVDPTQRAELTRGEGEVKRHGLQHHRELGTQFHSIAGRKSCAHEVQIEVASEAFSDGN